MDMFVHVLEGLSGLFGLEPMLAMTVGVILGILAGAMPGISPAMGVALIVPFTFTMHPSTALILLTAIYIAANYGGSITAVTINTPGTPSAVVTAFDGYPLALQGKAGAGLGVSLVASTVGGIIGTFILILFSAPLARIALQFWPAEYFALAVLGLSSTSSMGGANWAKIIVATLLGLLISTVGMDPILGVRRFTFGILPLYDGFTFIPALIGLLALSEVFSQIEEFNFARATAAAAARTKWPSILDYWRLRMSILRSSIIGTIVGIFPGAGATIATFICYDVEKRVSKTPEMFGKGAPEGVAAAEASNSASVGGAMVPLLTLGIPGSATAAVLLGALMIHNLRPGPELFVKNPEIVYKLFGSMIVANFIMLLLGLVGSRIWVNVTKVRKEILFPLIFSFALIGSYAVKGSMFDVATAVGFGILGWVLRRYGYPMAPVILGLVLGKMAEVNYRRTIMMFGPIGLIQRPIANFLLVLAVISFIYPIILAGRARVRKARAASA